MLLDTSFLHFLLKIYRHQTNKRWNQSRISKRSQCFRSCTSVLYTCHSDQTVQGYTELTGT